MRVLQLALVMAPAIADTAAAFAAQQELPVHYTFALSGRFMVPPCNSPVEGSADLLWFPTSRSLDGFVTFGALQGSLTSLEIHGPAGPGENAPLLADMGLTRHILITDMSHAMMAMLNQELLYVEVHTTAYPDGEERGQMTRATDAVAPATWTAVRELFR